MLLWSIATVVLVGLHATFNRFVLEFFEKQKIKKQFAGYASTNSCAYATRKSVPIKQGMKKEGSICFQTCVALHPLEKVLGDDVEGLTRIMNGYMDAITQPDPDADGMVIKYIGDASMHVHNAS